VAPAPAALIGLVGLASAMGIGRFAFTPLLPLMQQAGTLSLAQGGSLARANYLGYLVGAVLCMALTASPGRAARGGLVAVAALTAGMGFTEAFSAWVALRLLAGVASAFVLIGVSSWALPLLAARGRASWSGWVYSGVGIGIFGCGLIGLATGVLAVPPRVAWLLLAACSAAVAIVCWGTLGAESAAAAPPRRARPAALPAGTWRLVLAYGAFGFGYIIPATFLPAAAPGRPRSRRVHVDVARLRARGGRLDGGGLAVVARGAAANALGPDAGRHGRGRARPGAPDERLDPALVRDRRRRDVHGRDDGRDPGGPTAGGHVGATADRGHDDGVRGRPARRAVHGDVPRLFRGPRRGPPIRRGGRRPLARRGGDGARARGHPRGGERSRSRRANVTVPER
jgi:MFS family permease